MEFRGILFVLNQQIEFGVLWFEWRLYTNDVYKWELSGKKWLIFKLTFCRNLFTAGFEVIENLCKVMGSNPKPEKLRNLLSLVPPLFFFCYFYFLTILTPNRENQASAKSSRI